MIWPKEVTVKDLTKGSVVSHILYLATPVAITALTQSAYHLIDLYFIARIGVATTAGVSAAGGAGFIIVALMQVLSGSVLALISRSSGRRDQADAAMVFHQSLVLSLIGGAILTCVLVAFIRPYLEETIHDVQAVEAGTTFVVWLTPAYLAAFPTVVIGSALRGIGIVGPTIVFQLLTVVINALLAPILIAGWVTGVAMGVKGAGLASSISMIAGLIALGICFSHSQNFMILRLQSMKPRLSQWSRILKLGLPLGGEMILMLLSSTLVYYVLRDFGTAAQAGYGIGLRVMQTVLLPTVSIASAVGPIVGQSIGANKKERIREVFQKAVALSAVVIMATTLLLQWRSESLLRVFDADASTSEVSIMFLRIMSWSFLMHGIVYICSSMFQGLGNTMPSLISSGMCSVFLTILLLCAPSLLSFRIEHVWYAMMATVSMQSLVSLWLLHLEFRRRMQVSFPCARMAR